MNLSHRHDNNVRSLSGQVVCPGSTSLDGLPTGIYIVNGQKVMVSAHGWR